MKYLLPFLILFCAHAFAQTSGQWRMSKRNANGTYTDYGVTLVNGQIIYLSGGVPTALTLNATAVGLGNVSNALQLVSANNLSDLTNAGTARTNLGLGSLATLSTITTSEITNGTIVVADLAATAVSLGGNGNSDNGKLAKYDNNGQFNVSNAMTVLALAGSSNINYGYNSITYSNGTHSLTINMPTLSDNIVGNIVTTGDTGTITNTMLAGSIALSKLSITGTPDGTKFLRDDGAWINVATGITINTTTTSGASANDILISDGTKVQKLTPGTGVVTALANNVDAASGLLTYGIIGTSGTKIGLLNTANTWSAAQTISVNGAASTPPMSLTGTIFTGGSATTTKPALLIEPAGTTSAGWPTTGTLLGLNAPSGFTGAMLDLQVNGTRVASIRHNGLFGRADQDHGFFVDAGGLCRLGQNQGAGTGPFIITSNSWALGPVITTAYGEASLGFGSATPDAILARRGAAHVGLGTASATPATQTLGGCQGVGSDITGGTLNIGTRGTGAGTGGVINLQSHAAGASGSTLGTLVTMLSVGPSGATIGSSGSAISASLTTTTTWDPASLNDGASETKASITLTGVAVGDVVDAALTTIISASWDVQATVTATNTVEVRITNRTGGTVDLGNGTLRVNCIKF